MSTTVVKAKNKHVTVTNEQYGQSRFANGQRGYVSLSIRGNRNALHGYVVMTPDEARAVAFNLLDCANDVASKEFTRDA